MGFLHSQMTFPYFNANFWGEFPHLGKFHIQKSWEFPSPGTFVVVVVTVEVVVVVVTVVVEVLVVDVLVVVVLVLVVWAIERLRAIPFLSVLLFCH